MQLQLRRILHQPTYNANAGALELNVGNHSYPAPTQHTPTDPAYNPVGGIMTLTIAVITSLMVRKLRLMIMVLH